MYDEMLSLQAGERIAAMQQEARVYQMMIDAAPLRFRARIPFEATRRAVAAGLIALAGALVPHDRCSCSEQY